jgi:hypothetical protein
MFMRSKKVGQDPVKAITGCTTAPFNPVPFLFPTGQSPVSSDMILEFQRRSAVRAVGFFLARYAKGKALVSRSSTLRSASYPDIMTMSFDEGPGAYDRQEVALWDLSFRILR